MWVTNILNKKVHAYNMPPSAPKNLRATAGNARVTLNWQHPGLSGITKYQYRYRRADSATWLQDWTDIPGSSYTTKSFTVSDLTNDTDYVFSVRGSIGSNPEAAAKATATPLAPPAAPDAPEIAKLVAADGTITAYWHTPEDDPRAPITGYRVQYRPYSSSTWRNVTRANNVQPFQTITGLTNRRPYEVQVSAVNRVGTGQWAADSAVPQASQSHPSNPSNMETDSKYKVRTMYAYWASQYGSDNEHADTPDDVDILENSCLQETGFKMFWDLPSSKPTRHEAHFITSGGAGDVRHKFGTETVIGANQQGSNPSHGALRSSKAPQRLHTHHQGKGRIQRQVGSMVTAVKPLLHRTPHRAPVEPATAEQRRSARRNSQLARIGRAHHHGHR